MSTQVEKVIEDAEFRAPKQVLPDAGEVLFDGIAGRQLCACGRCNDLVVLSQRRAIDLAMRIARQVGQESDARGKHMGGKPHF
jgi:hypothetical protein